MIRAKRSELEEKYRQLTFAYNQVFVQDAPLVEVVMKDLAHFCRANESTFHADARIHAVAEGRREVWLRIQKYLNCSVEELLARTVLINEGE